jgi:hypothetical protein
VPSTPTRSPLRDRIDPVLIRQLRRITWVWTGAFLAAAAVFQSIDVQLPNPAWLVVPSGRSAAASVHAFVPLHLLIISWSSLLLLVVWALLSRELTRPTRIWPMIVHMVLGVVGAAFFGTLATGAIVQLGHAALDTSAAARLLVVPAEVVSGVATIAALISLIVVPGILIARRGARMTRPDNVPTL